MSHVGNSLGHIVQGESPQRSGLAKIALGEVESGLAKLASLGFPHKIVPVEPTQGVEWPKMLYRGNENRIVFSEDEANEAGKDGWDVHPSLKDNEATHDAGNGGEGQSEGGQSGAAPNTPPQGGATVVKKVEAAGGTGAVKAAAGKGAAVSPGNT